MDPVNSESNKDKYFKGQQTNENLICFFRHHWITLLREFLYFSIFLGIIIYSIIEIELIKNLLRGNRELKIFFFTGVLVATIYFHRFFLKLLNYFVNVGIITDMRIIDHEKTLYFTNNIDSIYMAQIQNIELKEEGILPSVFKFGDIKVFLAASDTVKIFHGVPNAKFHFRCISRQKEARQKALLRERNPAGILDPQNQQMAQPLQEIPLEQPQEENYK